MPVYATANMVPMMQKSKSHQISGGLKRKQQILQSSIPKPRDACKFAYNLMPVNESAHNIMIVLTAMIAGASDGGSTKLGLIPVGGFPAGI